MGGQRATAFNLRSQKTYKKRKTKRSALKQNREWSKEENMKPIEQLWQKSKLYCDVHLFFAIRLSGSFLLQSWRYLKQATAHIMPTSWHTEVQYSSIMERERSKAALFICLKCHSILLQNLLRINCRLCRSCRLGNDESISGSDQCGRTPRTLDGGAAPLLLMRATLMDLEN